MHSEAYEFVRSHGTSDPVSVIEIGSRNINGTVRDHFPHAHWIGLDLHPGPCVDVVCNAEFYQPVELVETVICCEVLEHAHNWQRLIATGASWLNPGGRMIVTCAGPGRPEHSAIDGRPRLMPGEYYRNLSADEVALEMHVAGLVDIAADQVGQDTQATGTKP